jgi:predicted nicotinamide N-methyase
MAFSLSLKHYVIGGQNVALYEPDKEAIAASYQKGEIAFPYWSQVWPAAIALSQFVIHHPPYIAGKKVLELAAGLGLPSIVAAQYATSVLASDYAEEALLSVRKTIEHHQLQNVHAQLLDWDYLPADLTTEVLLLSDVSYDAALFSVQEKIIRQFLASGTTVIISTPQRLIAKEAIAPLLVFCTHQEEIILMHNGKEVATTVIVLQKA